MKTFARLCVPIAVGLTVASCGGKTIDWKQEVKLHDGRVIVVERQSKQKMSSWPQVVVLEFWQQIAFKHPDTEERIVWEIPNGLQPVALDFYDGTPYYVLQAYTVSDFNTWGCPNPPYLIYRYQGANWQPVPFSELPQNLGQRNVLPMSKYIKDIKSDQVVTSTEVDTVIGGFPKDHRTIGREKVNPIAKGCFESVLHKQGRQSEIDTRR